MASLWRQAVWEAVQRQAREGAVTRAHLIEFELDRIVAQVGSIGITPEQTLSRELQELRNEGILIFDGKGHYSVASEAAGKTAEEAVATDQWRYQKMRLGQSSFRKKLLRHWGAACPLTGIREPELLRASHIIPWNRCRSEAERLDPNNGILLSPLWDAAFDKGLVSFDEDGKVLLACNISDATKRYFEPGLSLKIDRFNTVHFEKLAWHRSNILGRAGRHIA